MLPEDLSETEHRLATAFQRGTWIDLRTGRPDEDLPESGSAWTGARTVRAEVIAALLLGAGPPDAGFASALCLRGARVLGRLDLLGGVAARPLVCELCYFDQELRFVEAATKTVRLIDCHIPGFDGARMRAEGVIDLSGTTVSGVLRLEQARVVGEVCLRGARVGSGAGAVAVAADGLTVDGPLICGAGFTASGVVQLRNALVGGLLDLRESVLSNPGAVALRAGNVKVEGPMDATRLQSEGEVRLINGSVAGWMSLRGARLNNPGGRALAAGGIAVGGGLWCHRGLRAQGEIRLIGARVGGNLHLIGATLSNPAGIALNLDRSTLTDVDATDLAVDAGTVRFAGAHVTGLVGFASARLDPGPGCDALVGEGATIGGTLKLTGVHATGCVDLRTSTVGGRILLMDADLRNPGDIALRMSRCEVASDVFCGGMSVAGTVKITGARIANYFRLDDVRLSAPGGIALDAETLQAGTLSLRPREAIDGMVNLRLAKVGRLCDDPSRWPEQITLDGFRYEALEPHLPAQDRLRWLARDPADNRSQHYEQLAAVYGAQGQGADMRAVLYAKEVRERPRRSVLGRAWGILQDVTVAYGYRPWRAVMWMIFLLASGSIIFTISPPPPLIAGHSPHFIPVIYTLDLLVPVVDLGQKYAFNPAGLEQWFSYALVAAGWILATTIARAAARSLSRT